MASPGRVARHAAEPRPRSRTGTILFLYEAWIYGVPALMEHPSHNECVPDAPSSWMLPALRRLQRLPGVQAHHVHQCMFWGQGLKPTVLLAVHLPSMGSLLAARQVHGRCTRSGPHRGFWGVGPDGLWRTAHLKTYPSPLCRLMAASFLEETRRRVPGALCRPLSPTYPGFCCRQATACLDPQRRTSVKGFGGPR